MPCSIAKKQKQKTQEVLEPLRAPIPQSQLSGPLWLLQVGGPFLCLAPCVLPSFETQDLLETCLLSGKMGIIPNE